MAQIPCDLSLAMLMVIIRSYCGCDFSCISLMLLAVFSDFCPLFVYRAKSPISQEDRAHQGDAIMPTPAFLTILTGWSESLGGVTERNSVGYVSS